jgi:hypothetical protein
VHSVPEIARVPEIAGVPAIAGGIIWLFHVKIENSGLADAAYSGLLGPKGVFLYPEIIVFLISDSRARIINPPPLVSSVLQTSLRR